jgi:hypothetical protein
MSFVAEGKLMLPKDAGKMPALPSRGAAEIRGAVVK